jgi:hypothetical protein
VKDKGGRRDRQLRLAVVVDLSRNFFSDSAGVHIRRTSIRPSPSSSSTPGPVLPPAPPADGKRSRFVGRARVHAVTREATLICVRGRQVVGPAPAGKEKKRVWLAGRTLAAWSSSCYARPAAKCQRGELGNETSRRVASPSSLLRPSANLASAIGQRHYSSTGTGRRLARSIAECRDANSFADRRAASCKFTFD